MKSWFMTLPFLFVAGMASADDMGSESGGAPAEVAAPTQTRSATHAGMSKRLPTGDMRHCLDLKSNEAIIRCAETRRKR